PGGFYKSSARYGIPKGHMEKFDDSKKDTAVREFLEETGADIIFDRHKLIDLGFVKQPKKQVYCYAYEHDLGDDFVVKSNLARVEFPAKSGKFYNVPEIDHGKYFPADNCKDIILERQYPLIERLISNICHIRY